VSDLEMLRFLRSENKVLEDKALTELAHRNRVRLLSYLSRNGGNQEEATELMQDCLVAIFYNVRKPAFALTAKLDTYFFAIARNLWLKRLRSKRREIQLVEWPVEMDLPAHDLPDALWQEEPTPMAQLLSKISQRCKEVLTMIFVDDLGIKEIKEQLGYASEQAVRNKKSECLAWLRQQRAAQESDLEK
jgi:RNA polymerase sigma factor (sigma-70 family)